MPLALRLYPQFPVNVRTALRTTLLPNGGGPDGTSPILTRAGEGVAYSMYHMHRQIELYGEDAHEFCPKRWEGKLDGVGWGYLPFHVGPRMCLGSEFLPLVSTLLGL